MLSRALSIKGFKGFKVIKNEISGIPHTNAPVSAYHVPTRFSQVVKVSRAEHRTSHTSMPKLSKTLQSPKSAPQEPEFSTGFRAKGSHLRASTLVCTPTHRLSTRSHVGYTSPHGNDGKVHARHTARVRAQLDGWPLSPLTPQSLTTPQLRHRF